MRTAQGSRKLRPATRAAASCLAMWMAGCESDPATPSVVLNAFERDMLQTLSPLPTPPLDPTNFVSGEPLAEALGERLFFDERLSRSGAMSCATCHQPERGFADGLKLVDIQLPSGRRHTPSLLGAAFNRWQFWDGRADSLWAQAVGPLENPHEQNTTRLEVAHWVAADPELRAPYEALFGPLPDLKDAERFPPAGRPAFEPGDDATLVGAWDGMDAADQALVTRIFVNVAKSIAAYERLLVRGNAPFDQFAAEVLASGRSAAISEEAQRGFQLFVGKGQCILCHFGPNFSNSEFHNLGLPDVPGGVPADPGRAQGVVLVERNPFNGLSEYSDGATEAAALKLKHLALNVEQLGQFKTPSLRNLLSTAPYMHGGHFATLEEVLDFYNTLPGLSSIGHREESLAPLNLTAEEEAQLVAFLKSLEGEPLPQ